jgi:hypothetical protein
VKATLDLRREVDLVLTLSCFSDPRCEVVGRGLWFGPPGLASYYVRELDGPAAGIIFACPGCGELSSCGFTPIDQRPRWTWNGDRAKPTLSPSILADPAKGGCGWHGFLTAGRFQLSR